MNVAQQRLLRRISRHEFDDGEVELPFVQRLGRENGWSLDRARRAIREYRRFMFLAVTAGHPVTPSDQVDQVWHLHLTYTRDYWDRFCGQVLNTVIHHGPTRGGPAECRKFERWYQETMTSYRRLFGEDPPLDLWPPVGVRFGEDLHFTRVNTKRHWVVRKPRRLLRHRRAVAAAGLASAGAGLAGAHLPSPGGTLFGMNGQFDWVGNAPWTLVLVIAISLVTGISVVRHYRCAACGRFWSFRPNGFTDHSQSTTREEWECEECGHRQWKDRADSGGCGCGDGGCGGCGD